MIIFFDCVFLLRLDTKSGDGSGTTVNSKFAVKGEGPAYTRGIPWTDADTQDANEKKSGTEVRFFHFFNIFVILSTKLFSSIFECVFKRFAAQLVTFWIFISFHLSSLKFKMKIRSKLFVVKLKIIFSFLNFVNFELSDLIFVIIFFNFSI